MPRFLGIDPGLAHTGFGVIEAENGRLRYLAHGDIATSADQPSALRLRHIHEEVSIVIRTYAPVACALEELYFARNVTSALPVAQARGVMIAAAAILDIPVFEYRPGEVKRAVVGTATAEKHQVQEMVRVVLGLDVVPSSHHGADALAVAVCHALHVGSPIESAPRGRQSVRSTGRSTVPSARSRRHEAASQQPPPERRKTTDVE